MTGSIGLFDSGVGGLSVMNAISSLLPNENLLYFADDTNFPYGTKSPEEIRSLSLDAAHLLKEQGAKIVVVACHTATAHTQVGVWDHFPLPIIDMAGPTLDLIGKYAAGKRLAILGSEALIRCGFYQKKITEQFPGTSILPIAAQDLIECVQEKKTIDLSRLPLDEGKIDALLLGSTHFASLKKEFENFLGPTVKILDPSLGVAFSVRQKLQHLNLLTPSISQGRREFLIKEPKLT